MRGPMIGFMALLAVPAAAEPIRIVSWNINNLHHTEGEAIPGRGGAPVRVAADYERLRTILADPRLAGDILAFQETNGPDAVKKVLPGDPGDWLICHESRFDRDARGDHAPATMPDRIYTAVAVRLDAFEDASCTELKIGVVGADGRPTRDAAGAIVTTETGEFHVYSVHMKSGCHQDSIDQPTSDDCGTLAKHVNKLEEAIDELARRNIPFILAGDFNRRFNLGGFDDQTDEFWERIDDGTPPGLDLERSPKGSTGACWPGENPAFRQPIDFFLFDKAIWPFVLRDAQGRPDYFKLRFTRFVDQVPENERNKLSDHCPIRTTIDLDLGARSPDQPRTSVPEGVERSMRGGRTAERPLREPDAADPSEDELVPGVRMRRGAIVIDPRRLYESGQDKLIVIPLEGRGGDGGHGKQ